MSLVCDHCGCSEIDRDQGRGIAVCTGCGSVLEDQIIVSEIQFAENAMGGASVMGQYVSTEGPKSMTLGGSFHHGMGKESRQITLEKGRRRIQQLGAHLKLNQHCIDTAFNFYKMAVSRRLTQGRKINQVMAACVYIVCRTEGTSHMLLDLSDVLQIDVYTLGRTYLHLSKELCISIPASDPCLYIQRFAHKLNFAEKTHEVSMTALRLVSRMKRDWISQGRRPSGLCGAALLVAARIYDFNRNLRDIMRVVKIGEGTIRKRLAELEATPSSQLTIEEFQKIDLEEEMDPPCFTDGKRRAKIQQLEEQGQLTSLTDEIIELQAEIEKRLDKENERKFRLYKKYAKSGNSDDVSSDIMTPLGTPCGSPSHEDSSVNNFLLEETLKDVVDGSEVANIASKLSSGLGGSTLGSFQPVTSGLRPRPSVISLGITNSVEDYMKLTIEDEGDEGEEEIEEVPEGCELDLTGIDDEELDALILTESEIQIKTKLWMAENAEYLKELQAKRERLAKEQEEEANKPESERKKRRRPRKKPATKQVEHSTAADAIKKMLQEKKISSKINYDVLKDLYRTTPSTNEPTTQAESVLGTGPIQVTPVHLGTNNALKRTAERQIKSEPETKRVKLEQAVKSEEDSKPVPVIVESGPVQYDHTDDIEEEEEDEGDHDEDDHMISAAAMLGHGAAEEDYYGYEDEDD